jgi:hypothetical protein
MFASRKMQSRGRPTRHLLVHFASAVIPERERVSRAWIAHVLPGVLALALAAIGAAVPSRWAHAAADYPDKPILMIVPFAPGGASDFAARMAQPRLSALLGQQIVIENRDGASGNVGMEVAARKAPDG